MPDLLPNLFSGYLGCHQKPQRQPKTKPSPIPIPPKPTMPIPQHIHDTIIATDAQLAARQAELQRKQQHGTLTPSEHHEFAHLIPPNASPAEEDVHYLRHLCAAARAGYVHSLYALSFIFEFGDNSVPANPALAQRLMDICAKKQHPNALFQAALCEPDPLERNRLILIAAQKRSQTACWYLAESYAKGRNGFRANRRLATFYKKLAWDDHTWAA